MKIEAIDGMWKWTATVRSGRGTATLFGFAETIGLAEIGAANGISIWTRGKKNGDL